MRSRRPSRSESAPAGVEGSVMTRVNAAPSQTHTRRLRTWGGRSLAHPAREDEDRGDTRDHGEQDEGLVVFAREGNLAGPAEIEDPRREDAARDGPGLDRKSTRLKSSHSQNSYARFF